jgi:Rrf2 family protein
MVDLAANSTHDHATVKSVAERQGISENYLEQVFSSLRKAGLVKSIKGSQGGYIVNGSPSDIKVSQILNALEGSLAVVETNKDELQNENMTEQILVKFVWSKINQEINNVVESITLDMLVDEYKKLQGKDVLMFYI